VGASTKIRWRRYLNELRHAHAEIEFIKEISKVSSGEFQQYYEEYCVREQINLKDLNREHSQKIGETYNKKTEEKHFQAASGSQIILHEGDPLEDISEQYTSGAAEEYKMTKDEQEIHDTFNKIFRKLAMMLHPDKISSNTGKEERLKMLDMFKEAKEALEKRKYFVLLDLALKFDINVPRNYQQQIRWMKKEIGSMEKQIDIERKTYNYIFSECDTDEERDVLIKRFMTQLFGPQIFSN
jgi:Asp-tRNA(Asn)/Glu-tRNA(Gln) amidotransferase A subunit family amidase